MSFRLFFESFWKLNSLFVIIERGMQSITLLLEEILYGNGGLVKRSED